MIDKVEVKPLREVSPREIQHDNPEIRHIEEFCIFLGQLYNREVTEDGHGDRDPLLGDPRASRRSGTPGSSHRLARAPGQDRLPRCRAALLRDGEIVWTAAPGSPTWRRRGPATARTTSTGSGRSPSVTAIRVMQLRDEGRLDLDDPLSAHIAESAQRGPTIRRMLSHLSGLQREPVGDVWVTMVMPSMADVVASLGDAELVLKPGEDGTTRTSPSRCSARSCSGCAARRIRR